MAKHNEIATLEGYKDRIQDYYLNDRLLNDHEKKIAERWELAFSILKNNRIKSQCYKKYKAALKAEGVELSDQAIMRDFRYAEEIFAPIHKYTKEFLKLAIIESAMKDVQRIDKELKALYDLPKDDRRGSWMNEVSQLNKIKDKAEMRIIEASGLKITDPNLPDFSKLQFNQVIIALDPDLKKQMENFFRGGVIDITSIQKNIQAESDGEG